MELRNEVVLRTVSTVSDKELLKAPTMSISNIVGSRIAGVAAVQSSGQPDRMKMQL